MYVCFLAAHYFPSSPPLLNIASTEILDTAVWWMLLLLHARKPRGVSAPLHTVAVYFWILAFFLLRRTKFWLKLGNLTSTESYLHRSR